MGYTHYWERPVELPLGPFHAAVEDCRKLCLALPIRLGDAEGKNEPCFGDERICFNGRADGPRGNESYETFLFERVRTPRLRPLCQQEGSQFDFCKTEHRPYDLAVQCCLLILHRHLGNQLLRVTSDGNSAQWDDARDACQHVLGYGIDWGEDKLAPIEPQGNTR